MTKPPILAAFLLHASLYGASLWLFSTHTDRYVHNQEAVWPSLLALGVSLYFLWHVLRALAAV
jgi:hypothetical protein